MAEHNCPNCGAPLRDGLCDYCGTVIEHRLGLAIGKVVKLRFEHEGSEYEFDMMVESLESSQRCDSTNVYADDAVYTTISSSFETTVNISGHLIGRDVYGRDNVYVVRKEA